MAQKAIQTFRFRSLHRLCGSSKLRAFSGILWHESKEICWVNSTAAFSNVSAVSDIKEDTSSVAQMDSSSRNIFKRERKSHSKNNHIEGKSVDVFGTLRKILTSRSSNYKILHRLGADNSQRVLTQAKNIVEDIFAELDMPRSDFIAAETIEKVEEPPKATRSNIPPPRLAEKGTALIKTKFIKNVKKELRNHQRRVRILDIVTPVQSSSTTDSKLENKALKRILNCIDHNDEPKIQIPLHTKRSVCVEYVPQGVGLLHLREALGVYGDIVGSSFQKEESGVLSCYIEFKTVDSKEKALAARWIAVNGKQLSLRRADSPVTTIVRIQNVSRQTSFKAVHSACKLHGEVESLTMKKDASIDVHYSIHERPYMSRILSKLNEVTMDGSHWVAMPAPKLPDDIAKTTEGQIWAGERINHELSKVKSHLEYLRILLEDMQELHNSIMHIKECPKPNTDGSVKPN